MRLMCLLAIALCGIPYGAASQPTELVSCLEPGSYCAESPVDTLATFELGCGVPFYQFVGRLAFPPLVNVGPVTIAVRTLAVTWTPYPLYVELVGHSPGEPETCTTLLAGHIVLVAQGFPLQCGGVWDTIGPLDLTQMGVPLGSLYHIQLIGFREPEVGYGSTGFACIRVAAQTSAVVSTQWQRVKSFYK